MATDAGKKVCRRRRFDEIGAKWTLARIFRKGRRDEKRYYWCRYCDAYHLTRQEKRHRVCSVCQRPSTEMARGPTPMCRECATSIKATVAAESARPRGYVEVSSGHH